MFFGNLKSLNKSLVAYYSFENNVNDLINGNNGTAVGTNYISGKNGQAINFLNDNLSRYVDIPSSSNISFGSVSFSMSMWIYFNGFNTSNFILNKRRATNSLEYQLSLDSGSFRFIKYGNTNNSAINKVTSWNVLNPFVLNNWYHIVYTDNGIDGKLYINGISNSTNATNGAYSTMTNVNYVLRLAAAGWFDKEARFRGLVDELAIWKNRELTQTEVTQLYNAGSGKFYPF